MNDSKTKTIPYGTRVKYRSFRGTVVDPEEPGRGQPYRRYRPKNESVWVYLDPKHHLSRGDSSGVPRHGLWVILSDPALPVLPPEEKVTYNDFSTGQLVRATYKDGGVETTHTGIVTVEGGSVRLGGKDRFGKYLWLDLDHLDSMEVIASE